MPSQNLRGSKADKDEMRKSFIVPTAAKNNNLHEVLQMFHNKLMNQLLEEVETV